MWSDLHLAFFLCFSFLLSLSVLLFVFFFFFSSRRRHTRCLSDWSSDVCSSDLSSHTSRGLRAIFFVSPPRKDSGRPPKSDKLRPIRRTHSPDRSEHSDCRHSPATFPESLQLQPAIQALHRPAVRTSPGNFPCLPTRNRRSPGRENHWDPPLLTLEKFDARAGEFPKRPHHLLGLS